MKALLLAIAALALLGCEKKSLREDVQESISSREINTNDPTRGLEPTARKDARGEVGRASNVTQKPPEQQVTNAPDAGQK
jgi:hypothetical protein